MSQDLSVQLTAEIIYVVGTVNGTSVTFVKSDNYIWIATVATAEDGLYEINIIAYDEAGQMTEYNIAEYYGFAVIYDRTQEDVTKKTAKGQYNITDLNRVGRSVKYLSDWFNYYGYTVNLTIKTDWTKWDFPTLELMTTYLNNIQSLIDVFTVMTTTPSLPSSMKNLTYIGANNIEKILYDLKYLVENMIANFDFSGELYAGEAG